MTYRDDIIENRNCAFIASVTNLIHRGGQSAQCSSALFPRLRTVRRCPEQERRAEGIFSEVPGTCPLFWFIYIFRPGIRWKLPVD